MKNRPIDIGMLLFGVAAFGLSLGLGSTVAVAASGGNPNAMTALLNAEQTTADLLPAPEGEVFLDGAGLLPSTSRSLGAMDDVNYWVVLDQEGKVCLVTHFTSGGWSNVACKTAEDFQKSGVGAAFYSEHDYSEAYLIPDGLSVSDLPRGLTQLDSMLIVGDTRGSDSQFISLTAGDTSLREGQDTGTMQSQIRIGLVNSDRAGVSE